MPKASLLKKIEEAQAEVDKAKEKYDIAVSKLEALLKEMNDDTEEAMLDQLYQGGKGYDVIMSLLNKDDK